MVLDCMLPATSYESVWLRQPEPARAGDFVCVCVCVCVRVCVHSNCTDCKSTLQLKEQNKQIYVVYLELALAV